jgi:hypothetical protein
VPQIAVLLSTDDQYRRNAGLFSRSLARVQGLFFPLLQNQYSVEVLGEHQLTGRIGQYPLVVVPECDYLAPAFRKELADYVQTGGCLLLVGPGSAGLFESELDIRLHGEPNPATGLQLAHAGADSELHGGWHAVTLGPNARAFGRLRVINSQDFRSQPAASIASCGDGKAAAI